VYITAQILITLSL